MEGYEQAVASLPERLQKPLQCIPTDIKKAVHEIRLRRDAPVMLSGAKQDWFITKNGQPTTLPIPHLLGCTASQIEGCFLHLCDYSVHTHQHEIIQGYIATSSGLRVGVAGQAVMGNGQIISLRNITSLCVRIHRHHKGSADDLLKQITANGRLASTLICGEPSSGKTSLLWDIARQLSEGMNDRRYRVTVIDERGELSAKKALNHCDILLHFPKGAGIEQAVRCLAPDVVMFDELGSMQESEAVVSGLHAGVTAITTAHGHSMTDVLQRPPVYYTLRQGGFEKIVLLSGRNRPGIVDQVFNVGDVLRENLRCVDDRSCWNMHRSLSSDETAKTSQTIAVV